MVATKRSKSTAKDSPKYQRKEDRDSEGREIRLTAKAFFHESYINVKK